MKRQITAILLAWIIFLGIDFVFHASFLGSLWKENIEAFKSTEQLTWLIPAGYLSFLILTVLIGYLFFSIFKSKPKYKQVIQFALIFAGLFSLSNFLGWYSFLNIPIKHLVLFNLVYGVI